jgi:(E)-4-hydroxy-3-methylbut-2-enyl-diphosphate synthase
VGPVAVGGDSPITVQTMTKTDTSDINATVEQIADLAELGCDIVRIAVPDEAAAQALTEIRRETSIALVADIHFDSRLALLAIDAGVDGLRINPGNIGGREKVAEITRAAAGRQIAIRIGVNSGSLEEDLLNQHGEPSAEALVQSALRHVGILEDLGFSEIKISVKASDVSRTVEAYRRLSGRVDYPLHLGVTEAGTLLPGTVNSSVAMGILLVEGIGDTIRFSLTDTPQQEVRAGLALLRSLGLRPPGASVTSCPTCGRTKIGIMDLATRVEEELEKFYRKNPDAARPAVAVMGCMVNGPGEAKHADIAVAGGMGKAALYVRGEHVATVAESEAVNRILEAVGEWRD